MKTLKNGESVLFLFLITEGEGEEGDERQTYKRYINYFVDEFIPFHTFRFAFVCRDNDDFLYAIQINKEYYDIYKTEYLFNKLMQEEK